MIPGITASSPSRWSPEKIGPKLWVDDSSAIQIDSGVAAWFDKTDNKNDFYQTNQNQRPLLIDSAVNGLRAIRFDGISGGSDGDRLLGLDSTRSIFSNVGHAWSMVVFRKRQLDPSPTERTILSSVADDFNWRFGCFIGLANPDQQNRSMMAVRRVNSDSVSEVVSSRHIENTDWRFNIWSQAYTSGRAIISENGEVTLDSITTTIGFTQGGVGTSPLILGGNAGNTMYSDVDVACVVIGSTELQVVDRQKLEGWAAWRYGLQGNLPAGHPYKDAPP